MRAIVLDRPGSFRVAEVPDPTPGPGQVVVKVDACGICGTDLHIMDGEFPPTPYPITPGHEFAGTVAAAGADATMDLAAGVPGAVPWAGTGRPPATPWTARSPSTWRSRRPTRTGCRRASTGRRPR